ncbi:MAG: hypothetical protein JSV04_13760 [Candidatus Heimdallarchaeota archaeon]|nr:MAG: hypothetical protein JSV04_13760 [Candidatus Heimdallarchaeota archaeon]
MEIEENKYIVTWCLDREGPRICLRAVTGENQLQRIEITAEDFVLDFDVKEAHAFLNILNQLAVAQEDKPVVSEPIIAPDILSPKVTEPTPVPDVPPVISEPTLTSEVPPSPIEISPPTPEVVQPEPAPNEILQILKQSEQTVLDPEKVPIEEPFPPDEIEKVSVEPTKISATDVETASFFRTSQSKSPLEMLLEEEFIEEKEELPVSEAIPLPELEESPETVLDYTPDDLKTDSFFSKFDTKRTLDLIKEEEYEPEPQPEPKRTLELIEEEEFEYKPEPQPERAIELSPAPSQEKKKEFMTSEERRAAIEKERAERRRRLWELTRGF